MASIDDSIREQMRLSEDAAHQLLARAIDLLQGTIVFDGDGGHAHLEAASREGAHEKTNHTRLKVPPANPDLT